jgi:tRNA(Ile)-lysidine synthase TilS/MesJ
LEGGSPGTKASFFLGYLDRAAGMFPDQQAASLTACERCGQPTTGRFCAFCRARAQILGKRLAESSGATLRQVAGELSEEVLPEELYGHAARTGRA